MLLFILVSCQQNFVEEGMFKVPLSTTSQHDGQIIRMWATAPRLFLHEFLKPREDIKESLEARRIFEYKCSTTFYAPKLFVPTTLAHPSFILWWQELHDHIFNMPVHPLCLKLMPDFQPTSEVIRLSPFSHICS
jgi:hypothetical protein